MMEKSKNQGKLLLFTARRYGPIVDDGKTSICCQFAIIKVLERRLCYPCSDLCSAGQKCREIMAFCFA
jgi:hypothetical protein